MNKKRLNVISAISVLVAPLFVNVGSAMALDQTWGPQNRPIYDYSASGENLSKFPIFNSMKNSPIYDANGNKLMTGNETNFVTVRECDSISQSGGYYNCNSDKTYTAVDENGNTTLVQYTDYVDITPGKYYEVYVFYHNNASSTFNASGSINGVSHAATGIAQNVRLLMDSPEKLTAGQTAVMRGTLSWTKSCNDMSFSEEEKSACNALYSSVPEWNNSDKAYVYDTAFLTANSTVYLRYQPGSAVLHTKENTGPNGVSANGQKLDDAALFNGGAKLAWNIAQDNLWGVIPGCNDYAGYVTFLIKADQPEFYMIKQASKAGADKWDANITVSPNEIVDFRIHYRNTGTTVQTDVTVRDLIPDGFEYIAGSTTVVSPAAPNGASVSDKMFSDECRLNDRGCLNIGNYAPGDEAIITYKMRVKEESYFKECNTVLYNQAQVATSNGTETDRVMINVNKNCVPSELPKTGSNNMTIGVIIASSIVILGSYYTIRKKATK